MDLSFASRRFPRKVAIFHVVTAVMIAAAIALPALGAEPCKLERLVESPMLQDDSYSPVISVLIDDKPRNVLLDTGGFWSLISPEIIDGYKPRKAVVSSELGLQGLPLDRTVKVPSVQIGTAKVRDVEFYIGPPGYLNFDATLGANWLSNFDVEIDPVKNTASLFSHDHCDGKIAYWPHEDLSAIPFELVPIENHIRLSLKLNGQTVNAMLDTGAPDSVLSMRTARRMFDLSADSAGVQLVGHDADRRGREHKMYRYQFQSLEMGDIGFKNPWITLAEMPNSDVDMILGMHQLHGLHLFFAYKEEKLYISSAHGDIVARAAAGEAPPAAAPTSDPLARINAQNLRRDAFAALRKQDVAGAMAAIDKALQTDPGYADGYVARAEIHSLKGEVAPAYADFEKAIQLDPANPDIYASRSQAAWQLGDKARARADIDQLLQRNPAYAAGFRVRAGYEFAEGRGEAGFADMARAISVAPSDPDGYAARAQAYAASGDYAHAYEDQTMVVKLAPRSAPALNGRCWFGAILGKLDEALDDCDAALEMSPHTAAFLDSRGLVRLRQGQLGRAISDYSAALEANPKLASSLYGRSMAKRQKGDAAGADADVAAAKAIDPDIAQHFAK